MKSVCFVGVDTSNYTTSLAACDIKGNILANIRYPLEVKSGERGLRQNEAVFSHVKNLPAAVAELTKVIKDYKVKAIGYSATPRDCIESYMPCFLVGKAAAECMAAQNETPLFAFSHQAGHIMAALSGTEGGEALLRGRFAAFHLSGGTTELLAVEPDTENGYFKIEVLGSTDDINAGQLIDRIGVAMGLDFPCGPAMEKLAENRPNLGYRPRISVKNMCCNLSGMENVLKKIYEDSGDAELTSAMTQDVIARTVLKICANFRFIEPKTPILFAGGVMSNKAIRAALEEKLPNIFFAKTGFSADNAAGTSLLCRAAYLAGLKNANEPKSTTEPQVSDGQLSTDGGSESDNDSDKGEV